MKAKITRAQRTFAEVTARTGDAAYAAARAGYSKTVVLQSSRLLHKPEIAAEIVRVQAEILTRDVLPAAIQCLHSIIVNERAPPGARVQAAKVVLDRAFGGESAGPPVEPHEMTPGRLAEEIDKLTRLAADRAAPVEAQLVVGDAPAAPGDLGASPSVFD